MDLFLAVAQQGLGGRGRAAVDGDTPEVPVLGLGGARGDSSTLWFPHCRGEQGLGLVWEGSVGQGEGYRQREWGQCGLVGPAGPLGTMGHWEQQLSATLGTAGALFWAGEGKITVHGQGRR